ncbi:hypothetical protein [Nonlabens xiamenensis]|uniref:hypothetical protein n=1 Tax=Nonlabens xiamenensis TaxID=2341043 RepID=UPI000F60ABBF|nr:hypothetical protein [Nonlabens xiamenensis]
MNKTYVLMGAVAAGLVGLSLVGNQAAKDYSKQIDQLKIRVSRVDLDSIKFRAPDVFAKLDIRITNPTAEDFTIDGFGVVKVTRVFVKDIAGNVIAQTTVNQESISIPANSYTEIKNIQFQGSITKLLPLIQSISGIRTAVEIDILGTTYLIEND